MTYDVKWSLSLFLMTTQKIDIRFQMTCKQTCRNTISKGFFLGGRGGIFFQSFPSISKQLKKTWSTFFFFFFFTLSINGRNRTCFLWRRYPVSGLLLWSTAQAFTAQHQDRLPQLCVRGRLHRHSLPGLEIQAWKERRPRMASGVLWSHERKSWIHVQLAETTSRNLRHNSTTFSDVARFCYYAYNRMGMQRLPLSLCHRFPVRGFAASRTPNMRGANAGHRNPNTGVFSNCH